MATTCRGPGKGIMPFRSYDDVASTYSLGSQGRRASQSQQTFSMSAAALAAGVTILLNLPLSSSVRHGIAHRFIQPAQQSMDAGAGSTILSTCCVRPVTSMPYCL